MIPRRFRLLAVFLLSLLLMIFLSGCWDEHELHTLFIVTGVALDESDDPEKMDITVQIAKSQSKSSRSGDTEPQENYIILLKNKSGTMMEGLMEFNRDSSRTLMLNHNQVLLFGSSLAEQGIKNHIDLFMRDQDSRMEILMMVVDGRGEEALSAKLSQDRISGMFLSRVIRTMSSVSSYYQVRMLDFVSRLLEETTSPVVPIVTVTKKGKMEEIKITGMAVFKGDKMIDRLSNDETLGYIWAMGDVKHCNVVTSTELGKAVFQITKLDCKRDVKIRQDGGIGVKLSVNTTLSVGEISGFSETTSEELMPYLVKIAQEEIKRKIMNSFETARRLNADIYGFGTSVYRKYPKEWKSMKDSWDEIFSDIELNVQVKAHIPVTGQITQPLGIKEE